MNHLLSDRRFVLGGAAVGVLLAVALVAFAVHSSSSTGGSEASPTTTATGTADPATTAVVAGPTTTSGVATTSTEPSPSGPPTPTTHNPMEAYTDLPLGINIPSTSGMTDGQKVSIHVQANDGSKIFGLEARLCAGMADVQNSADYLPTQGGMCSAHPLSANSDSRLEVASEPPHQSVDVDFRVGVGTDSYTEGDGTPITITCGPGHPCKLVLKLQVPGGFGFRSYDVTYR